ncbi:quinone oxidoreductase family protein [Streptomyces specialis]|uniref:quinone oxidoreductase family protein n=1 Tax=Streptomyces specialis TaxID=498367 RepID=UPI00073FA4E4|nr:zinc-binding dehydrogenase [Streptomyces specialis]
MKAVVLRRTGGPEVLAVEEVDQPVPGPTDALVKVLACGVSGHDVAERGGVYRRGVVLPKVPGQEICGDVVAVGDRVGHLSVGDRVANKPWNSCGLCRDCRTGRETSCPDRAQTAHGGYGEYAVLPAETLVRIAPTIDPAVGAILGAAVGVALNAVRDTGRVRLGDTVLVTGASGGVGWSAVQLAALAGARVIARTRSSDKAEALIAAGAHQVLVDGGEEWFRDIGKLTEGRGVDVVIDTVGSRVFTPAFRSLAQHGRYVLVGQLSGEEVSINLARVFFKRAELLGVGSVTRAQIEDVASLVAAGRLQPRIAGTFPLEAIAEAHRMAEDGHQLGRVVVTPGGPR